MCDYMHYEEPRRHRVKKIAEPEPEIKIEEQPMAIKA